MRTCRRRLELRRGLSLPELLASMTILILIAGSLGTVATAVRSSNSYCSGQTHAAQHARAATSRIERNLATCIANEQFPGCRMFSTTISGSAFPDALVVWKPTGTAISPAELPRVNELLLYTYNPSAPNELIEIRDATNTATAPSASSTSAWNTLVSQLKASNTATRTVITSRLHTAIPSVGQSARGAIRFNILAGPTDAELASYRAGTLAWDALDWPQDRYGSTFGYRGVACQIELQIDASDGVTTTGQVLPFFGSGSFSYQVSR